MEKSSIYRAPLARWICINVVNFVAPFFWKYSVQSFRALCPTFLSTWYLTLNRMTTKINLNQQTTNHNGSTLCTRQIILKIDSRNIYKHHTRKYKCQRQERNTQTKKYDMYMLCVLIPRYYSPSLSHRRKWVLTCICNQIWNFGE